MHLDSDLTAQLLRARLEIFAPGVQQQLQVPGVCDELAKMIRLLNIVLNSQLTIIINNSNAYQVQIYTVLLTAVVPKMPK